ncbi:lysylphosphatidylglycerol synthase transmembrane domain-containing protein [Halococcus salsus]|uniref:lysylphosphatidylglycerol synthase transmembrane domain-containing protein n=1 Tax=Halococcus salsus TaxID=2162894 RepID=UPI0013591246|nr:lysylphosphatidylglycerol synthase transmembrane domain-containing protein [Halococcus salsus]
MVESRRFRTTALGFLGAGLAFAIAIWVIGPQDIYNALAMSQPGILVVIVGVAACWLTAWGLSLRTVLEALDAPIPISTAVLVFASATFANNVTPFGQAGGEPVSALLISRASDQEYETGLAAIASVDALNFVPSIGLALIGLSYFATKLTFGTDLTLAAAAVGLFAVVLVAAVVLGWRYRYRIEHGAVATITPLVQRIASAFPRVTAPESESLEARIEGFFTAVERVATNPQKLALALVFSTIGWIGLSTSLWLSLYAIGYTVPLAVVLVAIPAGAMASITPLPGGLGGVAAVLGALVVGTTNGVTIAAVTAAVLVHRGATYVLPTMVGGGVAAVLADQ